MGSLNDPEDKKNTYRLKTDMFWVEEVEKNVHCCKYIIKIKIILRFINIDNLIIN